MAEQPPGAVEELPTAPAERVRVVLQRIVDALGLDADVRVEEGEEEIHADVDAEDVGLLIGRRGQTIEAAQLVCFQAAFRGRTDRKRVTVDAGGYRARRAESLRRRADRAAEDAIRGSDAVELEPMSAADRRVVHEHLRDRPGIETYSEGDEPDRVVVVAPLLAD